MSTTDLFSRVYFNNGEGLTHGDLINSQVRGQIASLEQVLMAGVPELDKFNGTPNIGRAAYGMPFAIALKAGQAYPTQGSSNNKVMITAGTLFQSIAAVDGLSASILPFTFEGTEEVTIANGDATHPRVDIVQMSLAVIDDSAEDRDVEDATTRIVTTTSVNKSQRVQCTLSVKTGTAAATPTVPTLDSGCVAIATVLVGTLYVGAAGLKYDDTAGAVAVLHDQRMPLGVQCHTVDSSGMSYITGDWTEDTQTRKLTYAGGPSSLYASCPASDTAGRLVAASTFQKDPAPGPLIVWFVRIQTSTNTFNRLNNSGMAGSGSATYRRRFASQAIVDGDMNPSAGPDVTANAAGIGVPLWSNGRRAWVDPAIIDATELNTLALYWDFSGNVATQIVGRAQFWIAG